MREKPGVVEGVNEEACSYFADDYSGPPPTYHGDCCSLPVSLCLALTETEFLDELSPLLFTITITSKALP
jgi:hypothetical protein